MKKLMITLSAALAVTQGSGVFAATQPVPAPGWMENNATYTLGIASKGWADKGFSGDGWTHKSAWGLFKAKRGEMVTVTADCAAVGSLHPGVTVWFRPKKDKGNRGDNLYYVPDHFYDQTTTWYAQDAKDDTTGAVVGTINMKYVANGYDADGLDPLLNVQKDLPNAKVTGYSDGIPGYLSFSFVAAETGDYELASGGLYPFPKTDLDNSMKKPLNCKFTVSKMPWKTYP
jgi:hypothetical protein